MAIILLRIKFCAQDKMTFRNDSLLNIKMGNFAHFYFYKVFIKESKFKCIYTKTKKNVQKLSFTCKLDWKLLYYLIKSCFDMSFCYVTIT